MTIVPLVVGYFAIQWNRGNFLGKTPEQIVAMGRDKWSDLYGTKVGLSTRDMSDAQEKFGLALLNLNDRAIKRLPRSKQIWLHDIRKTTTEYAMDAHMIGRITSGGGTIWQNYDSTIAPDIEEIVSDCITDKPMPMVKMKSFEASMQELDKSIAESKDVAGEQYQEIPKYRRAMSKTQNQLEKLFVGARQNDVTRIRLFMHRKIEVAKGNE